MGILKMSGRIGIVWDYKGGGGRGGNFLNFPPNVKTLKKCPKDSKKEENTCFSSN